MPPSVVPPPRRPDETFLLMASVGPTLWVMNVGMLAPLGIGHVSSCSFGLLPLLRWALYGKMPLTVVPPPWRPTKTVRKSVCLHLIGHTSLKPARWARGFWPPAMFSNIFNRIPIWYWIVCLVGPFKAKSYQNPTKTRYGNPSKTKSKTYQKNKI